MLLQILMLACSIMECNRRVLGILPEQSLSSLSGWSISPAFGALCCCGAQRLCEALAAQTHGQIALPAVATPAPRGTVLLLTAFTVPIRQTAPSSFLSNLSNYPGFWCIWLHTYRLFPKGLVSINYYQLDQSNKNEFYCYFSDLVFFHLLGFFGVWFGFSSFFIFFIFFFVCFLFQRAWCLGEVCFLLKAQQLCLSRLLQQLVLILCGVLNIAG